MMKWMRDARAVVAVMALALSAACSNAPLAEKSVGNTGGTVAAGDGTTIDLPPGAVPGDTPVTITPTDAKPTTSAATVVTDSYLFGPEGIQFAKAVTVKIPFDAAKLPSGAKMSDLVILTAPKDSTNFVRLSTHVEGNLLVAETMHFSVFTGALVPGAGACDVSCIASANCSPSGCAAGPASCRSSCDGQNYEVDCNPDGSCMCVGSGSASTVNVGALSATGPSQQVFNGYQMCGFPGEQPCVYSCSNNYNVPNASTGGTPTSGGSGSNSSGLTVESTGTIMGCGCIGTCMGMGNSLGCDANGNCTCGGSNNSGVPNSSGADAGTGGTTGPAPASTPVMFSFSCGDDLAALEAAWKNNCNYPGTATVPADSSSSSSPTMTGSVDGGLPSSGSDGGISGGSNDGGGSGGTADAGSGGSADMGCTQMVMSAAMAPCAVMTDCGGTTYALQCMTGSSCQCIKNGMVEKMVNNLGCADPLSTYKTLCGYP